MNEAPEIRSDSKTGISYRENGTSTLYTYTGATDPEKGDISWSVRGTDVNVFEISGSGRAEVQESAGLRERWLTADQDNEYEVTVVAGDGGGLEGTLAVTVTVTDQNEGPEVSGTTTFTITENQELVGARYTGTDPEDPAAQITRWSVTGRDGGDFRITEEGELSFRNTPNYEKPVDHNKDNEYEVTVRASDGRHYGTLDVVVTVSAVNEAPEIRSDSKTEFSYEENENEALYTYRATDPEGGTVAWALSGSDSNEFSISDQGVLAFNISPDYDDPADSDQDNVYEITVEASDPESTTARLDVTVTVTNLTD